MKHNYILKTILLTLLGLSIGLAEPVHAQCTVDAGSDIEICPGGNTTLTAIADGGSPNSYSWGSIPANLIADGSSITVSPGVTTSYVVYASGNGCNAYDTVLVTVKPVQPAILLAGNGVDTSTFNGALTFYICAAAAQQAALFNFTNGLNPNTGYTTTISWGDTAAPVTTNTPWTTTSHIYRRGIYTLTYTVTDNSTGCSRSTNYRVFYGSNPAGGIASPGNTDICGPDWLTFSLYNYQNNTAGTIYRITFSDSTAPLIFTHPPPDNISHYFERSSCGFTSTSGSTTFPNSFSASLVIENPCGVTAGAVVPIYVSIKPKADYSYPPICANTPTTFTNTSTNGMAAGNSGCNSQTPILWSIQPATGWTITSGNMGSDNGYTGNIFNPTGWTSGSNTLSVSFTTAGNYQFQIIAGNKCTADTMGKTICVSAAPSPMFSVSAASSCAPFFDTLTNLTPPTPGCSEPTYNWGIAQGGSSCTQAAGNNYNFVNGVNNDSTTAYLQFNNEGTYNVSLNATNVCGTFTSSKIITVKQKPEISISVPPAGCFGQAVSPVASVKNCGGTMDNFSWSFPGGTPTSSTSQNPGTVDYATSGNYAVSLSAENECGTASANTNIRIDTIPAAHAGTSQQMCSGSNLQIGSTPLNGLTYSWTPATGLSDATIANPMVLLTNTGSSPISQTYMLTTSSAANCSSTETVTITVYPAATVNAGPEAGICAGGSVTLEGVFGGSATSAIWSAASGTFGDVNSPTSIYTPSISSGSVTLTLTTNDPSGPCPAVSSTVNIFAVTPPVANAGPDVAVCGNDTIRIGTAKQNGYTYQWTPATGLSDATKARPIVSITNTGTGVITQTYTLNVSATGCSDTAQVTVSIYPAPAANAGPAVSTCAGGTVNLTGTISGAATSANWSSPSGTFSQNDTLKTQFTPSGNSGTVMVFLTTDQPSATCPAVTDTVYVTIKPIPVVTPTPFNQTICSGDTSVKINLSSNVPGTTYSWTGNSPDGITGFTASGIDSVIPAQVLRNLTSTNGTVVYTITPTNAGCVGVPTHDSIFILPALVVNPIAPQTVCSSTSTAATTLTANIPGTLFSWTATSSANLWGYTASGNGSIPAQTITNNSPAVDTVFYTITGTANGCGGTPVKYIVIVNPPLQAILPPAQQICNGTSAAQVTLGANLPGATFSWTATASSGITGYADSGSGNIPAQTIYNSSSTSGTVSYSINATGGGCNSIPQTYTITVDPPLTMSVQPATDSICTGTVTNFILTANIDSADFSWTVIAPNSITGAANGAGNTIRQTLINTSTSPQEVTYIITPTAKGCGGTPDTTTVVVKPGVIMQLSGGNQAICSGQTTQPIQITSPNSSTGFHWTSQSNNIIGAIGFGNDSIPAQTLTNPTAVTDTVIYTVVPNSTGCTGQSAEYIVVVQPGPTAILPAAQTVCSGIGTEAINLESTTQYGNFNWTGDATNGITGFIASGTSPIISSHVLTNTTATAGVVTYRITPMMNGCTGPAVNYTINVDPLPSITTPAPQNICTGGTTSPVTLTSPVAGTTFSWVSFAPGVTTGNTASGTGNIPAQTLLNPGTKTDTVTYVITPTANGCTGPVSRYYLYVNPTPTLVIPTSSQTTCSGTTTQAVNLSSPNSGANITWTATVPNGITGAVKSGTNTIPAQTLFNNTIDTLANYLTVNYSIQMANAASGCSTTTGSYTITVKPKPIVDFSVSNGGGCAPVTIHVMPKTFNFIAPDSLVFKWGDGSPNTVVRPSGQKPQWAPIQHAYYNNTGQVANFPVTMVAHTACVDTSIVRTVTVSPNSVNAFFTTSPATGCEPLTVSFYDQSTGNSNLSWCFDYNRNNNTCNGAGVITKAGATVQHTFSAGSYTVALYASQGAGCAQDTIYQTINVNAGPKAEFNPSNTLCEQTEVSFTSSSIPPPGTFLNQYTWNFGDGVTSSLNQPTHTYGAAGTYNVCLSATASGGCTDTMCKPVTVVTRPQVDFNLPDACLNAQTGQFINRTTGATFYKWMFGDNTTSAAESPVHPYMTPGTYTVQLVGATTACADTMSRNITIFPLPDAAFTVPSNFTCGLPSLVTMQNSSEGAIGYTWDFGNGDVSTYPNPTTSYAQEGSYMIKLTATNQYSCSDTATKPISIYPYPNIQSVSILPAEGCAPVNVHFNITATNAKNFVWDFGDGTTSESTLPFADHQYSDTGTYSIVIRAYSFTACGDTLMLPDTVTVHIRPTADFTYTTDEEQDPATGLVQFTNTSINSTIYLWRFNDGDTSGETHPQHVFPDADNFRVMLIASTDYGCSDTAYKNINVIKKTLYTPNAFAPDYTAGSDLVRVWKPAGTGLLQYHAQVFNKWGELLWESRAITEDKEPAEGWDGTYQGKVCQQDVYVWKIEAIFVDGDLWKGTKQPKVRKTIGSVTLIR